MKRVALGRGLDALIPSGVANGKQEILEIEVARIYANPDQPRKQFDEAKITELAQSISEKGLIQPVVVRRSGEQYELIIGERRFRAIKHLGLDKIPGIIYDQISKREIMEMALIENIQREDLNPIEEAEAFRVLLQEYGISQEDLAAQVGKDRSSIANTLRLLTLPDKIKQYVMEKKLAAGAARVILAVPGEKEKVELAEKAIKEAYSVRELERIVYGEGKKRVSRRAVVKSPHLVSIEENLKKRLQTKVAITPRKKGGRIVIDYYGNDGLTRILERLNMLEG
jgi:ParB family chromosome partitioning protein